MLRKIMMTAGLAALMAAAPATAEDKDKDEPKEKKICRTEKITGSLTRVRRTCMTEEQWDALADRTRKSVDKMQSGAAGGAVCTPDPNDPFRGCN